jgi:hypothetical protein
VRRIGLGGKNGTGKYVLVSEEDFERVASREWTLQVDSKNPHIVYARTGDGKGQHLYLHRFILGDKKGYFVDHINRNTLDNRRKNLRHLTPKESIRNRSIEIKGYTRKGNKWQSQIKINDKQTYLGLFATKKEASEAYLQAKKRT